MRAYIKIYFDFEERTEELTEAERWRLIKAMLYYAEHRQAPDLRGNERYLFPVFKGDVDRDVAAYDSRLKNGQRGGRPKNREYNDETEENRNKPNETEGNRNETEGNREATRIKTKDTRNEEIKTVASHTVERIPLRGSYTRAREGGYLNPAGETMPCRYDNAWQISEKARGAVAQRITQGMPFSVKPGGDLYGYVLDALKSGVSPELIEDLAAESGAQARFLALLTCAVNGRLWRPVHDYTGKNLPSGGGEAEEPLAAGAKGDAAAI